MSLAGVGGNGGSGEATEMPSDLAMMLPKAPEGWTMRPTEPGDIDAFLPAEGSEKALREVRAAINPRGGNGVREVRMTYANGARKVVFELVRYPDFVFTSFAAAHLKMELQMNSSRFSGRGFMTVRGMEINENELPDEIGLRYLVGDVAGQIWLRALAPRTMTDQDLLPFFETLHVPAMNANVIEKVAGMGEVPVIVVASVLEEESPRNLGRRTRRRGCKRGRSSAPQGRPSARPRKRSRGSPKKKRRRSRKSAPRGSSATKRPA